MSGNKKASIATNDTTTMTSDCLHNYAKHLEEERNLQTSFPPYRWIPFNNADVLSQMSLEYFKTGIMAESEFSSDFVNGLKISEESKTNSKLFSRTTMRERIKNSVVLKYTSLSSKSIKKPKDKHNMNNLQVNGKRIQYRSNSFTRWTSTTLSTMSEVAGSGTAHCTVGPCNAMEEKAIKDPPDKDKEQDGKAKSTENDGISDLCGTLNTATIDDMESDIPCDLKMCTF